MKLDGAITLHHVAMHAIQSTQRSFSPMVTQVEAGAITNHDFAGANSPTLTLFDSVVSGTTVGTSTPTSDVVSDPGVS